MKFEAAWVLSNLAFGNEAQTQVVIDHGAIGALIHCYSTSADPDVQEQSIWGIANIAGMIDIFLITTQF